MKEMQKISMKGVIKRVIIERKGNGKYRMMMGEEPTVLYDKHTFCSLLRDLKEYFKNESDCFFL